MKGGKLVAQPTVGVDASIIYKNPLKTQKILVGLVCTTS